ncbi:hypothetical protein EIN_508740 [Entamoeba invadens IP1]|uniref:TLDc domain-containing protein n=1 Tax=Entamoeba invadens IP1 TaxID=370355 RepID=A0A0A1UC99_ENTIV|nr:hypothetical protein EIN_508740 [Entamoeba invadens IP1]ELP92873.1 hypothetical protein EIN_508740 [Entamoeba invadens IP1]|eukprot:XP_004259644.1 hypothetical protein EIN_508740 [Entamoeba invadens IP1]
MNELNLYGVTVTQTEVITGELLSQILTNMTNMYLSATPSPGVTQQISSLTTRDIPYSTKSVDKEMVQKQMQYDNPSKIKSVQPLYTLPPTISKTQETCIHKTELPKQISRDINSEQGKPDSEIPLSHIHSPFIESLQPTDLSIVDNNLVNTALVNSLSSFQKWTGYSHCKLIFDTAQEHDQDIHEIVAFNESVINKKNLIFIMFDVVHNVFGCYVEDSITKVGRNLLNINKKNFPFVLHSNVNKTPIKFITKTLSNIYLTLTSEGEIKYGRDNLYFEYGTVVSKLVGKTSQTTQTLSKEYFDVQNKFPINKLIPLTYHCTQIVVVQLY